MTSHHCYSGTLSDTLIACTLFNFAQKLNMIVMNWTHFTMIWNQLIVVCIQN